MIRVKNYIRKDEDSGWQFESVAILSEDEAVTYASSFAPVGCPDPVEWARVKVSEERDFCGQNTFLRFATFEPNTSKVGLSDPMVDTLFIFPRIRQRDCSDRSCTIKYILERGHTNLMFRLEVSREVYDKLKKHHKFYGDLQEFLSLVRSLYEIKVVSIYNRKLRRYEELSS